MNFHYKISSLITHVIALLALNFAVTYYHIYFVRCHHVFYTSSTADTYAKTTKLT